MKALLTSAVLLFTAIFIQTITAADANAWNTEVHLRCSHAPWGNCPAECRDYKDCLTTPPPAGCATERTALCDCLQDLNPNYNCTNIPNTVGMAMVQQMLDLDQSVAINSTDGGDNKVNAVAK